MEGLSIRGAFNSQSLGHVAFVEENCHLAASDRDQVFLAPSDLARIRVPEP